MNNIAIVNANSFAKYFPEFLNELEKIGDRVERFTVDKDISAVELAKRLEGFQYLIVGTTPKFDKDFFANCSSIKYIARFGIGYNNVDVLSGKEYDVMVSNIPGYLEKEDVAEQAVGLLMSLTKHTVDGNKAVLNMEWNKDRGRFLGTRLRGKTVGVLGMGNIGATFARIMKEGFGCEILGYDPYIDEETMENKGVKKASFKEVLQESDILSLHINLTEDTYHLINKSNIKYMKDSVYIINTARGELVNQEDICEALNNGKIKGYGADVIENEPPKEENPLLHTQGVVLTPHLGTYNQECNRLMNQSIIEDIRSVIQGGKPAHLLNE